jgi:hypothetical protein
LRAATARGDHRLARLALGVLLPLRLALAKRPNSRDPETAIYLCGVGLKIAGIGHPDLDAAIEELDQQLPEDRRREACDWANKECKDVRDCYLGEDAKTIGWLVAARQIKGLSSHNRAYDAVMMDKGWAKFQQQQAAAEWNKHMAERGEESDGTAGVDANWNRIVVTDTTAAISFGDGSGGASIVNGVLSVVFKK